MKESFYTCSGKYNYNFKSAREAVGMKLYEAADALGVTTVSLSNYESERTEPKASTLIAMSDLYKVSINYLLNLTPKK